MTEKRALVISASSKSRCSRCWAEVRWFKRPDGRTHQPMVPFGHVMTLGDDQVVREAVGLIYHHCSPENLERVKQLKADREAAASDDLRRARKKLDQIEITSMGAEEAYSVAMRIECPQCTAAVGKKCLNLNKVNKRGNWEKLPTYTKWPHPDRVVVAESRRT